MKIIGNGEYSVGNVCEMFEYERNMLIDLLDYRETNENMSEIGICDLETARDIINTLIRLYEMSRVDNEMLVKVIYDVENGTRVRELVERN